MIMWIVQWTIKWSDDLEVLSRQSDENPEPLVRYLNCFYNFPELPRVRLDFELNFSCYTSFFLNYKGMNQMSKIQTTTRSKYEDLYKLLNLNNRDTHKTKSNRFSKLYDHSNTWNWAITMIPSPRIVQKQAWVRMSLQTPKL